MKVYKLPIGFKVVPSTIVDPNVLEEVHITPGAPGYAELEAEVLTKEKPGNGYIFRLPHRPEDLFVAFSERVN